MKQVIVFVLGSLLVFLLGWYGLGRLMQESDSLAVPGGDRQTRSEEAKSVSEAEKLTAEYGQFARLTIPWLSSVETTNKAYEIVQTHQVFDNFTSYIASYDSEGLEVRGLLTVPKGEAPEGGYPAVVFLHGYIQPDLYETTERYNDYVNYMARNGLVVFKIDYRGHDKSEGDPKGAYYSGDYVVDTLNAVASLAASETVNGEKIGLWGHSMSGNVLMRAMAANPKIKAGVIWAGAVYSYTDMQKYGISDSSFVRDREIPSSFLERSRSLFETVGRVEDGNDFWDLVAVTNYLDRVGGAVQLHHAANDSVVNIAYANDLAVELKKAGVEYELFSYNSGGHNLVSPAFGTAMQRSVEFYKTALE